MGKGECVGTGVGVLVCVCIHYVDGRVYKCIMLMCMQLCARICCLHAAAHGVAVRLQSCL